MRFWEPSPITRHHLCFSFTRLAYLSWKDVWLGWHIILKNRMVLLFCGELYRFWFSVLKMKLSWHSMEKKPSRFVPNNIEQLEADNKEHSNVRRLTKTSHRKVIWIWLWIRMVSLRLMVNAKIWFWNSDTNEWPSNLSGIKINHGWKYWNIHIAFKFFFRNKQCRLQVQTHALHILRLLTNSCPSIFLLIKIKSWSSDGSERKDR